MRCLFNKHYYTIEKLTLPIDIKTNDVEVLITANELIKYTCKKCQRTIYDLNENTGEFITFNELYTKCIEAGEHLGIHRHMLKQTVLTFHEYMFIAYLDAFKLELIKHTECEYVFRCVISGLTVILECHDYECINPSEYVYKEAISQTNKLNGDYYKSYYIKLTKYPNESLVPSDSNSTQYKNIRYKHKSFGTNVCLRCNKIHDDYTQHKHHIRCLTANRIMLHKNKYVKNIENQAVDRRKKAEDILNQSKNNE